MEIKELREMLSKSAQSNKGRYIPWWEGSFEDFSYKYDLFSEEEIEHIEACVEKCGREELEEDAGGCGYTLFHLLVWHNFYHAVEKILDEGRVQVNIPDCRGRGITALLLVCCCGNAAMAELLLKHGADASLCDAEGNNGYHYLAHARADGLSMQVKWWENSIGQRAVIARLLTADINGRNKDGLTPFEVLLDENNPNLFYMLPEIFIEKGAKTDIIDENGNTLLMRALNRNHVTAAVRLMKCSDLINRENNEGISPLKLVKNRYNEAMCIALKDHGAALPDETERIDLRNLSRITSNTFAECSPGRMDHMELALHLAGKLIRQIDTDDDDEMKYIVDIMGNALREEGDGRVLELCHASGIDFTAPIHSGGSVTCLRDACLNGNCGAAAIQKMIELSVDMEAAVVQGKTPANVVASRQERNMMFGKRDDYFEKAAKFFSKESMEQADNGGTTAVHQAAKNNHAEMLKVMIEKGVDVNLTEDAPAEAGNTPLHTACIWGNPEVVRVLLEAGADDRLENINGEIPAHLAVMKKKFGGELTSRKRAELLKELKTLDAARNDGKTPLMLLQFLDINTNLELLPIFLDRGADVNRKDSQGNTALIYNTMNQCFKDIIKELIRSGADVNIVNSEGNTALHYALRYGSQDTARFLIKKGADYNHANNQGVTPVQLAVEKGYDTVLELMTDIR